MNDATLCYRLWHMHAPGPPPCVLQIVAHACTPAASLCVQEPDYEEEDVEQAEQEERVRPPHTLRTPSERLPHTL